MGKVFAVRLEDETAEWLEGYLKHRKMSKQVWLESAVAGFREDCESGVPEFKERARAQAANNWADARNVGVGVCPKRLPGLGHIWAGVNASGDSKNPCKFCGTSGREFFQRASAERAELFSALAAGMENGTGKPEKVKHSPAQEAKVGETLAEAKRRQRAAKA